MPQPLSLLFSLEDDADVGYARHELSSHVVSDADANGVAFVQMNICEIDLILETADAAATLFS